MARRSGRPIDRRPANLTPDQMKAAIPKLDRRIKELGELNIDSVQERSDPRIEALSVSIDSTLATIFGSDTEDFHRYSIATRLDTASINLMGPTPIREVREGLEVGIARAIALLEQAKVSFHEELEDSGLSESNRALRAFEGLDLHPEIERASGDLYRNGHFANAIEDAVKALNSFVRLRSGLHDLDGTALMERVFSVNNPILRFNNLSDQPDRDEQKGFMMLFSGAVMGLRNPRAHKLFEDDPERALEFIAFVSLLAKLLDNATKA